MNHSQCAPRNLILFLRFPRLILVLQLALALVSQAVVVQLSAFSQNLENEFYRQLPKSTQVDLGMLESILPNEAKACDEYWTMIDSVSGRIKPEFLNEPAKKFHAQQKLIACGKWLFFYMPLPTQVAMPDVLISAMEKTFPDLTGPAFAKVGFRENPNEKGKPLEMPRVPGVPALRTVLVGSGRTLACTGCHLGKLPSGEFSVGMPNEELDLGLLNQLTVYPMWLAARGKKDGVEWDPKLREIYEGMWESSKGKWNLPRILLDASALVDFLNLEKTFYQLVGQDPLPLTDQRTFYKSGKGRLNPSTPMLSEPNLELYVSIPPLWNLSHHAGTDIGEPYLGRVVSSHNLEQFVDQAFVLTTLETKYSVSKYRDPLAAYLRTLKAPRNPSVVEPSLLAKGASLFATHCISCHNGTEGATREHHLAETVNSPRFFNEMFRDYSPPTRQSKMAFAGMQKVGMLPLFRPGLKSRRFNGLWARRHLGTNGSIDGLNHFLCLEDKTRKNSDPADPLSDGVHKEICEEFSLEDRNGLREWLSHNW
jgi:hypothetical protein